MSATAATAIGTLAALDVVPSLTDSVSVAAPLKSAAGLKLDPASAALIAAALPLNVTLALPLPDTPTPAVEPSVKLPWFTATVTVSVSPSTSVTLNALPLAPENTSGVSSLPDCAGGTLTVGASSTGVTVPLTEPVDAMLPLDDRVAEADRPVEVGRGREHQLATDQQHAAAGHRHRRAAVDDGGTVDLRDRQRAAIGVAVVGEHVDRHAAVFGDRERVGVGHRRIGDRADRARHRRAVADNAPSLAV